MSVLSEFFFELSTATSTTERKRAENLFVTYVQRSQIKTEFRNCLTDMHKERRLKYGGDREDRKRAGDNFNGQIY